VPPTQDLHRASDWLKLAENYCVFGQSNRTATKVRAKTTKSELRCCFPFRMGKKFRGHIYPESSWNRLQNSEGGLKEAMVTVIVQWIGGERLAGKLNAMI
jgi:hypothetical protein